MRFNRIHRLLSIVWLAIICCTGVAEKSNTGVIKVVQDYWPGGHDYIPDAPIAKHMCHDPRFECVTVKSDQTWDWLFKDPTQCGEIMRLNRTDVPLAYRTYVIRPKNLEHINYMSWSPLPKHFATHDKPVLLIDLNKFAFGAYAADGHLIYWGPAEGGKKQCDGQDESCKTATGDFHVDRIGTKKCISHTYPLKTHGGAPMPYCMFFYKGFSIHGSTLSGFVNRSHGCVHVFINDAKWLNEHFVHIGTRVIVRQYNTNQGKPHVSAQP